jgi:hypothetical protein
MNLKLMNKSRNSDKAGGFYQEKAEKYFMHMKLNE